MLIRLMSLGGLRKREREKGGGEREGGERRGGKEGGREGGKEGGRDRGKREGGETQLAGELCHNYKVEHLFNPNIS